MKCVRSFAYVDNKEVQILQRLENVNRLERGLDTNIKYKFIFALQNMPDINAVDELEPGDAIVFQYWGIDHEGIVTSVTTDPEDKTLGIVHVIHYAFNFPITRSIKEERFFFDLNQQKISKKGYENVQLYDAATTIKRARARVGEQRHNAFNNTSRHLVEWAKVGNDSRMLEIGAFTESNGLLRLYNAYSWYDLKEGCILEYSYYGIRHQGVVTKVNAQENMVTVAHYGTLGIFSRRTVMKDKLRIDFKTQALRIYRCDPAFNHNAPDVVITKAEQRMGEQNWSILSNTSWMFCLHCLFN
ncbi:uncharacterized protein LOC127873232 isoform X2 [Dreissena polymorpha]|uniref:uncharacterized protein LOC127873232 isoform X2 n=1 Tax=Dreissena polymorpha TaxID=45954 RepID=UPI00226527A7|nr:uncharacterized protein LOC127873232 isoform X2 [Dreissena polymorpha]